MKISSGRVLDNVLRMIVVGACCAGIWSSWKLARADYLFHQNTDQSIRSAILLAPDAWEYFMRLAQMDRLHASDHLETALRLNRYIPQADIELGLRDEADGDYSHAEKLLLQAYEVDRTYVPRWTLANYYLRRGDMPAFWTWVQRAAEMPGDDMAPLFELCWRVTPDPDRIAMVTLRDQPGPIRQYLDFLLGKDQLRAASATASQLVRYGNPATDLPLMFSIVDRMVAAKDAGGANELWNSLIKQRWVVSSTGVPYNADFARVPLPVSFDWTLPSYPGLHSWPGPSGLEVEFTGEQPEDCAIAEQTLVLVPGNYTMDYSYYTRDIPPDTGVWWQIVDATSNTVLANSPYLSSDALKHETMAFSVGQDSHLLRLRLTYRRTLGTPRISGAIVVRSTQIQAQP